MQVRELGQKNKEMQVQFELFERGNVEELERAEDLIEKAELLPFDQTLRIPYENLTFEQKIDGGAFGVVWKAWLNKVSKIISDNFSA